MLNLDFWSAMETVDCWKEYQESLFINMHNIFKTINLT